MDSSRTGKASALVSIGWKVRVDPCSADLLFPPPQARIKGARNAALCSNTYSSRIPELEVQHFRFDEIKSSHLARATALSPIRCLQSPLHSTWPAWPTPAKGYLQMQIDFVNGQSFRRRLACAHLPLAGTEDSFSFWLCGATNLPLPLPLPDQAATATRQLPVPVPFPRRARLAACQALSKHIFTC